MAFRVLLVTFPLVFRHCVAFYGKGKHYRKEKPPGKILSSEKRPRKHLRIHRPAAGLTA